MLCRSCGTECTDELDICPGCGTPLKKASVSDDTVPLPQISDSDIKHARKKPIKLDIAAILAADPEFASDQQLYGYAPVQDMPEPIGTLEGPFHDSAAAQETTETVTAAVEEPAQPVNPIEVLLLSLCILLGMAIVVMIILIIWPNLIPMLFYRA